MQPLEKTSLKANQFMLGDKLFEFKKNTQASDWKEMTSSKFLNQFKEWGSLDQMGNTIIFMKDKEDLIKGVIMLEYRDGTLFNLQFIGMSNNFHEKIFIPKTWKLTLVDYNPIRYVFDNDIISVNWKMMINEENLFFEVSIFTPSGGLFKWW
jgi:hypothetical protein